MDNTPYIFNTYYDRVTCYAHEEIHESSEPNVRYKGSAIDVDALVEQMGADEYWLMVSVSINPERLLYHLGIYSNI